jgi:hypothetical protein
MASNLRDFWFPVLLALLGVIPLFFAGSSTGNARRIVLTTAVVLFFLAVLSYIWGDPVRGPFANLVHPRDAQNFTFQAGASFIFPVSQLKDGIDFSRCVSMPGQPIEVWVQKTWWSGLYVRATLKGSGGRPVLTFDNKRMMQYNPADFDVNYDEYDFEIVNSAKAPQFQLVIAKDYSAIYLNARVTGGNPALILKDNLLAIIRPEEANQPQYKLDRIFKYPSYIHQGERD